MIVEFIKTSIRFLTCLFIGVILIYAMMLMCGFTFIQVVLLIFGSFLGLVVSISIYCAIKWAFDV